MDFTLATQIQCCREINGQTHSMEKIEGHKSRTVAQFQRFTNSKLLLSTQMYSKLLKNQGDRAELGLLTN